MDGTPYWGKTTQSDIRGIKNLKSTPLTTEKINDLLKARGLNYRVVDLYTLFLSLSDLDMLYIQVKDDIFVTWCRDIRFNYRDQFIFIPYYTYETSQFNITKKDLENPFLDIIDDQYVNIRHSFELHQHIIDDRKKGERVRELGLYDKASNTRYSLKLPNLPYLIQENFSTADLSKRYIQSAFIISKNEADKGWKDYLKVNDRSKRNREHHIRNQMKLKLYKNKDTYKDFTYTDVRQYEYNAFDPEVKHIDLTKPYWKKMYEFEAYLYCIFAQGIHPLEEEYREPFNQLGKTIRNLTIQGVEPLILKHYYKNGITLRRKSYERYR